MKNKNKKTKIGLNMQKIICKEGFVEILHFEGGRILPSVGEGGVAFWGEAEPGEGCTLSMRGRKHESFPVRGKLALHFGGKKLDFFPIMDIISLKFRGRKLKSFFNSIQFNLFYFPSLKSKTIKPQRKKKNMWGRVCGEG